MPETHVERPPWTRSRSDRIIAGVCGGFAARMRVSTWLVRIVLLIAAFVTAGLATVAYVLLALLLPLEPAADGDEAS
jgi:phage shock protein C